MTRDARSLILDRIDILRRELDVLYALVRAERTAEDLSVAASVLPAAASAAPASVVAPAAPAPAPAKAPAQKAPPVDLDALTIGPAEAAELLGVARQTVDRRLKDGKITAPGSPHDVSGGKVRSRWRWVSEDDVRTWWSHVG